ncbi:methyltransferase domain-containing protein [soil metagenome]
MNELDANFWQNRYEQGDTAWDLGMPSPPLAQYIDQLKNRNIKILIPGAGNSYEAEYLYHHGFKQTYIIDLADAPLKNFKSRVPAFPIDQLIQGNFFDHHEKYDLILEQTFFCAINPALRKAYVKHMAELLNPDGILAGLLFDCEFEKEGPPFGGSANDYRPMFSQYFELKQFNAATNSIPPRAGREIFIECRKKNEE